ncbi:MAG: alpha/beta fold hydrolase [Pseudomonadota bacterium]
MTPGHCVRALATACLATVLASSPDASAQEIAEICDMEGEPCQTPNGTYRIEIPDRSDNSGPVPAVIFFHGAGGSGSGTLSNRGMTQTFLDRGYAVIAPDGMARPGRGAGWSFHPDFPPRRDERAFADEVMDDAAERFNLDRDAMLMSGFSIGGSLTWYLACQDPDLARAYAPVAGAFWRPHPEAEDCAGPVRLFHTHGWRDTTVPLEGRPLRNGEILQGDVFAGLEILREVNGCDQLRADEFSSSEDFWVRWWTRCDDGTDLRFALTPSAHGIPQGWSELAIDWFEGLEP